MDYQIEGIEYWKNRPFHDERKDWNREDKKINWIDQYWESRNHPHRQVVLDAVEALNSIFPIKNVLEIGCNAGPNLGLIKEKYPHIDIAGVDVNEQVIAKAENFVPQGSFRIASADKLQFLDKAFSLVIADAVLMYVNRDEIWATLTEMKRVATFILLVEWDSSNKFGKTEDGHWARDYKKLLEEMDFTVNKKKLTFEEWPTTSWTNNGYIYAAVPVLKISNKSS